MLKTIIDYTILDSFFKNQPPPIPVGSELDHNVWLSFWSYIKSGSDLCITNSTDISNDYKNVFLTDLTTGRKGTKCIFNNNFKTPYKFVFPKKQNVKSMFFLNVIDNSEKTKYRNKNGYLFGFNDDYMKIWKDFALIGKPEVLPVRKKAKINFNSWHQLSDYILPFTDLIIVDNYMLDESIWEYNLFRILEEFNSKATVKFNLLLVSYDPKGAMNIVELNNKINSLLKLKKINCDLSIILANQQIKEHDRGLFSNYIRIKSGDSFTFFNKKGDFITKGTDIDFHTLSKPDKINASDEALKNIKYIIQSTENNPLNKGKRLIGSLKNRLFDNL